MALLKGEARLATGVQISRPPQSECEGRAGHCMKEFLLISFLWGRLPGAGSRSGVRYPADWLVDSRRLACGHYKRLCTRLLTVPGWVVVICTYTRSCAPEGKEPVEPDDRYGPDGACRCHGK